MDWQQVVSLVIVGVAAALLTAGKFRQRRLSFQQSTGCGCGGSSGSARPPAIVFRARKGRRPEIRVKAR